MKNILTAAALLLLLISCSKEEEIKSPADFFYIELYKGKDLWVSYNYPDNKGPFMEVSGIVDGSRTIYSAILVPRDGSVTNAVNSVPYFYGWRDGITPDGSYNTAIVGWKFKDRLGRIITSCPGRHELFLDRLDDHPEYGPYVEGRILFNGCYRHDSESSFPLAGSFRLERK